MIRRTVLVMALLVVPGCRDRQEAPPAADTTAAAPAFDWTGALGVAVEQNDTLCLRTARGDLAAGTPVLLVLASQSQSTMPAEVVQKVAACADAAVDPALATASFYQLKREGPVERGNAYIAVIGEREGADDRPVEIDVDQDGMPERFRECTSAEGLHLTVWTGEPLLGSRRWHYYHYLGHDLEPSCSPADYEPASP